MPILIYFVPTKMVYTSVEHWKRSQKTYGSININWPWLFLVSDLIQVPSLRLFPCLQNDSRNPDHFKRVC